MCPAASSPPPSASRYPSSAQWPPRPLSACVAPPGAASAWPSLAGRTAAVERAVPPLVRLPTQMPLGVVLAVVPLRARDAVPLAQRGQVLVGLGFEVALE